MDGRTLPGQSRIPGRYISFRTSATSVNLQNDCCDVVFLDAERGARVAGVGAGANNWSMEGQEYLYPDCRLHLRPVGASQFLRQTDTYPGNQY